MRDDGGGGGWSDVDGGDDTTLTAPPFHRRNLHVDDTTQRGGGSVQHHLNVTLGVSHDGLLVSRHLADCPHPLCCSQKISKHVCVVVDQSRQPTTPSLDDFCGEAFEASGWSSWSWIKLRNVDKGETMPLHELHGLFKVVLCLGGETAYDVCRNHHPRHSLSQEVHNVRELLRRVLALHCIEYRVASSLDGNVEERVHVGSLQQRRDRLQVLQNVRWVRHPNLEHDARGKNIGHSSDNSGERRANVTTVSPGVLAREAHFSDALLGCDLESSRDNGVGFITAQLASRVLGLAIGAVVQAARIDRNHFDVGISSNFG
mmetsp:Transcript_20194/g.48136  ORF Transcript_20194/g.48136 Transcript_20194/m.48136 type:complete len:316 (-) Transcript_20194:535-1482(-)